MLFGLPSVLLAQAVSQSLLPQITMQATHGRYMRMSLTILKIVGGAVLLCIPAALALYFFGKTSHSSALPTWGIQCTFICSHFYGAVRLRHWFTGSDRNCAARHLLLRPERCTDAAFYRHSHYCSAYCFAFTALSLANGQIHYSGHSSGCIHSRYCRSCVPEFDPVCAITQEDHRRIKAFSD